ncbi:hypothetical protein PybrP1_005817 [[Pythium] brassicae (nom. inval.)]|nr:hypothetical protein PybrP1_005817 [[Pythium] brassicae (nom. inval.)]
MDLENAAEFKLFASALICVLALVGGAVPLLLRGWQDEPHSSAAGSRRLALITSVLNMFAGGIFLSGAVLHLLPDAQENEALARWMCASEEAGCFKWANFFFGSGFLLVLLLEVFAHAELTLLVDDCQLQAQNHFRHHESCSSIETDASGAPDTAAADEDATSHDVESGAHSYKRSLKALSPPASQYGATVVRHDKLFTPHATREQKAIAHDHSHTHAHAHGLLADSGENPLLALIVFAALSFHSVMEGMGIGAAPRAAWDVLAAVLAHKSLAAFALVQELLLHRVPRRRVLASIGMFSAMTPVGILLGSMVAGAATGESVASGVCTALAGGTFLFVAAVETLPQELQDRRNLALKCGALLAGYGAMGMLSLWA